MFKENQNTTEAIIELIKTLPKNEQTKIANSIAVKKPKKSVSELTDAEYVKRLKKFNDYVMKNRFIPEGFKFDREEAHERK
jgi:hypothetical protein